MMQRSNFWWVMIAEEINPRAKDFIKSLTSRQIIKLESMFYAIPDSKLIMEMMADKGAIEKIMHREDLTREDIKQIEAETFGIFACVLLGALKKRLDDARL